MDKKKILITIINMEKFDCENWVTDNDYNSYTDRSIRDLEINVIAL